MSSSESVRSSSTTASAYSLARSRNSNQAARVFDIPELLKMIASFLRSGDVFHLALSSRAGFHAAVVQLWKSLRGTRRLFALLSGSSVAKSGADGIVIALPDLSTCDFSRFNYYAALVRKIHWHPLRNEIISDWRSFIPYTYNRSLLPNLQHIELPPNLPFHTSLWCPTLCSSSLLAITTGHAPRQSSPGWDDASTVFGTLELRSPGLRALCLFRISKFTDEPTLLIRPQNLELYKRIACMKNLRLLSIEEFKSIWGIDSLVAQLATYFAQLSELQQLSIGVDWESCIELDGMSLRPTYVSESLRRLEWTNDPGVSVEPKLISFTTLFLLSFWPNLRSLDRTSSLTVSNYKISTPWLVNEQLQAEQADFSKSYSLGAYTIEPISLQSLKGVD
ncbi:hypothetical protein BDV93DRAFT_579249 [Ceratobasidium sp. AG-I]|nr:hypothetical protein BDV93DRAFT_579249 [Ceratobasidium sp. AG-I]